MVDGAINAAAHLEAHSAQAKHAQRVQQDTVASAMRLGATLTDLTNWTAVEMERLNDTATAVYHDIVSAGRFHGAALHASRWNEWYTSAIIWSVQLVLGGTFRCLLSFDFRVSRIISCLSSKTARNGLHTNAASRSLRRRVLTIRLVSSSHQPFLNDGTSQRVSIYCTKTSNVSLLNLPKSITFLLFSLRKKISSVAVPSLRYASNLC